MLGFNGTGSAAGFRSFKSNFLAVDWVTGKRGEAAPLPAGQVLRPIEAGHEEAGTRAVLLLSNICPRRNLGWRELSAS